MTYKLRQFLFRYQHLPRFSENFGDTGVPMVLKCSTSSLVGCKGTRLTYMKIS